MSTNHSKKENSKKENSKKENSRQENSRFDDRISDDEFLDEELLDEEDVGTRQKRRGIKLLLAAAPLLLVLLLSTIAYFAGFFVSMLNDKIGTASSATTALSASDEGWVFLIQYLLYIIFFGVWYWYLIQKKDREEEEISSSSKKKASRKKTSIAAKKKAAASWNPVKYWAARLPLLLVLGYALQLGVSALLMILSTGFPTAFSAYKELIATMAGDGVDIKTFIAVSFLAPVAEELIFRGVSYTYAEWAIGYRWAILFQAVVFGLYHGNLIQFIYATAIGYLLGALRHQSGSIVPGIVLHTIINLSAYLVPAAWIESLPKAGLMALLSTAVIVPCCIILLKKKKRHSKARKAGA